LDNRWVTVVSVLQLSLLVVVILYSTGTRCTSGTAHWRLEMKMKSAMI